MHIPYPEALVVIVDGKIARETSFKEMLPQPQAKFMLRFEFFLTGLRTLLSVRCFFFNRFEVLEDKLGFNNFDISLRIDAAVDMDNVCVIKTSDNVRDRINFPNMREKLIAKPLPFAGSL